MLSRPSLRTALLVNLAIVAAAALALGVASVLTLYGLLDPSYAPIYISVLVAADVFVLVAFVAYLVDRTVLGPLRQATQTAEAIAAGDLQRRLAPGETGEMSNLAESVNRMTDRLLEERAHLVRVEKMASVGRLAAGLAHEIGNPLGAINGYLHVLRAASADSSDARDALAGLERESARIDRIVRGLLDYARPKPRNLTVVDVNASVRTVIELLSTQGILKQIAVELSPAKDPSFVLGDRHDLEQAFVNLILNAVDAMQGRGSLSVTVRHTTRAELAGGARRASDGGSRPLNPPSARAARWLAAAPGDRFVVAVVTDSGPGIRPEDAEHVFEPFFTTKEPGKGTGLGLAIVARAVEDAGGAVWVSPSREGGAAFRILFPMAQPGAPARVAQEPARRAGATEAAAT